jgi:choline kinase
VNWKKNYVNRDMHPTSEAENVIIDREDNLVDIGKNIDGKKANGEFIGLIKLNNNGCKIFKKYFDMANKNYKNKEFFNSKNIKKAYITDFLRYLILKKIKISCLKIKNNWMEIDTIQDLSNAQSFYK